MRKIIDGKAYDTEKAREVGEWATSYNRRDFHYCIETLYCKRTGEYFIHGEGGPASNYAERVDVNSWSGGEKIFPVSLEKAKKWAEEKLRAEDYEKEFGYVTDEGNDASGMVTTSVSLNSVVYAKMKQDAYAAKLSLGEYIRMLMSCKEFLDFYAENEEMVLRLYEELRGEHGFESKLNDYKNGYLTENGARNGRVAIWYYDGDMEAALYEDTGEFLSSEDIEKELN